MLSFNLFVPPEREGTDGFPTTGIPDRWRRDGSSGDAHCLVSCVAGANAAGLLVKSGFNAIALYSLLPAVVASNGLLLAQCVGTPLGASVQGYNQEGPAAPEAPGLARLALR